MASVKRKFEEDDKPKCKYGMKCYQKNPEHLSNFEHNFEVPKVQKLDEKQMSKCLKSSSGFFFTKVRGIDEEYNNENLALGITDILNENCDLFVESAQFNFMFDVPWLLNKYPDISRRKPMLLVHGMSGGEQRQLVSDTKEYSNISLCQAKLPIAYGTHHSKMMLLLYTNGLRVIIHTANLIEKDWNQKTQGIWRSPLFRRTTDSYNGQADQFKKSLKEYLMAYENKILNKWIQIVDEHDMITANAHIIASVPGRHFGNKINQWGHLKLRKVLKSFGHGKSSSCQRTIVGQFSSIGSLGDSETKWLTSEWLRSLSSFQSNQLLSSSTNASLKLVFPTIENVRCSLEGYSAGGSIPFSVKTAMKQRYMRKFLCQWRADGCGRSVAAPHIKSYACIYPSDKKLSWFLLTSANLSKAAWGAFEKNESQLMIRSYEIGVLITPKPDSHFTLDENLSNETDEYFRLPYDVPLTPYTETDKPWVWDIRYTKEDRHGRLWIPT